jgi:long-chain acyl-CoA synthetase
LQQYIGPALATMIRCIRHATAEAARRGTRGADERCTMPRNLGALIPESAPAGGDAVAFQARRGFRRQRVTFREAAERARRVAGWLMASGLAPGDRLAVWSPNLPEYAVLCFGAWLAGVVAVPIDVRTPQDVVHRFVAAAEPRLGFTSRSLDGTFGPPVEATRSLEDLFDLVAGTPPLAPLPRVAADQLAEIAYTSGTTGLPKGVTLTHANLLAEVAALRAAFPLGRDERALSVLPLSHILELTITLLLGFACGVRVSYVPRLSPATLTRALREDRVTCLVVVPELLRLLLAGLERGARQQGHGGRWRLAHRLAGRLPLPLRRPLFWPVHRALGGRLRFFGVGGAPLDVKLAEAWERMGIRVFEGYGLTEAAGAATLNTWTARRLGSAGRPLPGLEIRIGDDDEVLLRGPTVTRGYFGNAELTAASFADGWLRTGDRGRSMRPACCASAGGRPSIAPPWLALRWVPRSVLERRREERGRRAAVLGLGADRSGDSAEIRTRTGHSFWAWTGRRACLRAGSVPGRLMGTARSGSSASAAK